MRAERGILLLPLIPLLTIIALLSAYSFSSIFSLTLSIEREVSSDKRYANNTKEALSELISSWDSGDAFFRCTPQAGALDLASGYCALSTLQSVTRGEPLIFDMEKVLNTAQSCPSSTPHNGDRSTFGFLLSMRGAVKSLTCGISPTEPRTQLVLKENIESFGSLIFKPSENGASLIASPGYIDITATLETAGDLIVFAGGDIRIAHLEANNIPPPKITIISMTGIVMISSVEGTSEINVRSHLGSYLSGTIGISNNHLWPPVVEARVLSAVSES